MLVQGQWDNIPGIPRRSKRSASGQCKVRPASLRMSWFCATCSPPPQSVHVSPPCSFVTRTGSRLLLDGQPFTYVGANSYYLLTMAAGVSTRPLVREAAKPHLVHLCNADDSRLADLWAPCLISRAFLWRSWVLPAFVLETFLPDSIVHSASDCWAKVPFARSSREYVTQDDQSGLSFVLKRFHQHGLMGKPVQCCGHMQAESWSASRSWPMMATVLP